MIEKSGTFRLGDKTIHRLGFGAMRITGPGIWGDPPDVDEARAVLRRAVELGIDFIDTADSYGPEVSERLIGETLAPYPPQLLIATKGGLIRRGPDRWVPNGHPAHLKKACEGSLRRLRLERIELYQFHRPDPKVPIEDSLGALVELRQEGKIAHVGVSNFTVEQLERAVAITPIVSVQNRYNVSDRSSEPVLRWCERKGIGFIPWAPIKWEPQADGTLRSIAEKHGATPHQVALAWLLRRSPVMLPIPGTSSVRHLESNVAAAAVRLADDEVRALDALG